MPKLPDDMATPAYVLDVALLKRNLATAARIKREAGIKMLNLQGIERILEVGCGSGWFASNLCIHIQSLTAIDPLPDAISECKSRCFQKCQKPEDLSLCIAVGENLPFCTNSFDILVFWASYHHLNNPSIVLREAQRVLKAQGRLLLFAS